MKKTIVLISIVLISVSCTSFRKYREISPTQIIYSMNDEFKETTFYKNYWDMSLFTRYPIQFYIVREKTRKYMRMTIPEKYDYLHIVQYTNFSTQKENIFTPSASVFYIFTKAEFINDDKQRYTLSIIPQYSNLCSYYYYGQYATSTDYVIYKEDYEKLKEIFLKTKSMKIRISSCYYYEDFILDEQFIEYALSIFKIYDEI